MHAMLSTGQHNYEGEATDDDATAAFCLLLLGNTPLLLYLKKFRKKGDKGVAVRVFCQLEVEGLEQFSKLGAAKELALYVLCTFT